jgi:hypothetical protein
MAVHRSEELERGEQFQLILPLVEHEEPAPVHETRGVQCLQERPEIVFRPGHRDEQGAHLVDGLFRQHDVAVLDPVELLEPGTDSGELGSTHDRLSRTGSPRIVVVARNGVDAKHRRTAIGRNRRPKRANSRRTARQPARQAGSGAPIVSLSIVS